MTNLDAVLASFDEVWSPRIAASDHDHDLRLAHVRGEHVWHVHANSDELFCVLAGALSLGWRDADGTERHEELGVHDVHVVPAGTWHRPVSAGGADILMVELTGTLTTGDDHEGDLGHVDSTTGHLVGG